MNEAELPSEFDGYRLIRQIGAGGMGRVFLGHDTVLDRAVAIKFVSAGGGGAEVRRRFLVEARAIAKLQHPCVVAIYRVGELNGSPYLVSEFVAGISLDQLPMPVPWSQVARIGYDLARGLSVAHRAGVVHRDIKPANAILSEEGTAKLLDFGIARLLEDAVSGQTPPPPNPNVRAQASSWRDSGDSVLTGELDLSDSSDGARIKVTTVPHAAAPRVMVEAATVAVALPDRLENPADPAYAPPAAEVPGQTRSGMILGTPAYLAPEVWHGEPAGFAADIYSLGALLFSLCTGHPPHEGPSVRELGTRATTTDAPALASLVPEIPPALASAIDRCLRRNPAERFTSANEVREALLPLVAPGVLGPLPEGNPYRGLRSFEAGHQGLFFGRDAEIRAILDRLLTDSLVVVSGDSGVGKSSLCKAGVLPRVGNWLSPEREWTVVTCVPGKHPVASICSAMEREMGLAHNALGECLLEGPAAFSRSISSRLGDSRGVVLLLDQLEELVTLADPDEAKVVSSWLGWMKSPGPSVRILATARGDFLGRLAALEGLGDSLSSALYFLRPLDGDRIREAVVRPALCTGVTFESEALVDELVRTTQGAAGGLPLLQFALQRLWEERDTERQQITSKGLQAVGGVAGALSLHADQHFSAMAPPLQQRGRQILLRLVTPEGTRARRSATELTGGDGASADALDALIRGRLIVALEGPDGASCEIAHEALLTGWNRLSGWLVADAGGRVVRERITLAAAEWVRLGRPAEALWTGRRLLEAATADTSTLSEAETAFLASSARRQRRTRLLKWISLGVAIAAAVGTYAGFRVHNATELEGRIERLIVKSRTYAAEADQFSLSAGALELQAFALFDKGNLDKGEALWEEASLARIELRRTLGKAGQQMEAALALGPSRPETRIRFAELLFARALEAEHRRDETGRDELLGRLQLYDDSGERISVWQAPGRLSLILQPPGAKVRLERFEHTPQTPWPTSPVEALPEQGSLQDIPLEPGSYLLTLEAAGRATTRLPFLVGRGQQLALRVWLPPEKRVPEGFEYVPAGPFLFGSSRPDELRRGFLNTVPEHQMISEGFLIARHETTFGQWLEYLAALKPEERLAQTPVVQGGFQGALTLHEVGAGRWKITYAPTSVTYEAMSGSPLVYGGRTERKQQDWLSFPVVGITAAQAQAYTVWLRASGKVAGARLCTELEWERAARGADGREYPHGDVLRPSQANIDDTYGKAPDAMGLDETGSHPDSRSPYGLDDMAGNAWEWTTNSLGAQGHAARGGSFYFGTNEARTTNRELPEPSFRDVSVGMRVCADLTTGN